MSDATTQSTLSSLDTNKPDAFTVTGPHATLFHPHEAGETTLFLVRHGQTAGNVARMLHGSTNLPLDALGLRQAALIAERLEEEALVDSFDALIASPLQRARTTAELIGERVGMSPMLEEALVEINFGSLEGYTIERIVADHPDIAAKLNGTEEFLGWPGGDTVEGFHTRVLAAFMAIAEEHHRHRVIVVAHGGVIGSFLAQLTGLSPRKWERFHTANCSLTHVSMTRVGTEVHLFNDCLHLDSLRDVSQAPLPVGPAAADD